MDVRENGCKQFVSYFSMPVGSSLPIFQVRYKCYYLLQCFKFSSVSGSGSGKVRMFPNPPFQNKEEMSCFEEPIFS
jgi:hypothetical protein